MWLVTTIGFFSIAQKTKDRGTDMLTVRARVRADLERLRERYLPGLGEIAPTPDRDYAFRARVSRQELAEAMGRIVADIDYPNFKSAVAQEAGYAREQVYDDVWEALLALQYGKAAHGG